jgi:hypothetical protein
MSHKISNTYAAKVFAEHPLALWNLDDEIYYVSALNSTYVNINNWIIYNSSGLFLESYTIPIETPLSENNMGVFRKTPSASVNFAKITSASISYSDLDQTKNTINISAFIYEYSSLIDYYDLGFEYSDGTRSVTRYNSSGVGNWLTLEHLSTIPLGANTILPFIEIKYLESENENVDTMINSISVGQWSEIYIRDSEGSIPETLTNLDLINLLPNTSYKVIPVDAYGFRDEDNGYVIVDNNKILSTNENFPMVYGATNITNIHSPVTNNMPSIVFPGKGFLNKNGEYVNLTAEFWLRINPTTNSAIKIFGPMSSNDGLYVDEEFITIQVGKYSKSYFIGKWYRPMLVDIRYSSSLVSVLINGDEVISMNIDISQIELPPKLFDWIGFFGNEDIYPFQVDCLAIYPYLVPDQVAKRRFIYGQAVPQVESITNGLGGDSFVFDFAFANYTSTINYPDMNSWTGGYFNNLNANTRYLGFQEYSVPEFKFTGELGIFTLSINARTWDESALQEWIDWLPYSWLGIREVKDTNIYDDNFLIQDENYPFIKIRPNSAYDNIYGSIEFDSINPIFEKVSSVYGIFKAPSTLTETPQTLMHFYNSFNSNVFTITLDNEGLKYKYNDDVLKVLPVVENSEFAAGINIDSINQNYSKRINDFFANPQSISMSLLGKDQNIFLGKFFNITFNNSFFTTKDMLSKFEFLGFALGEVTDSDYRYVGNYTLKPLTTKNSLYLDVCSSGYWEDSLPLSYFGKLVTDKGGSKYYDLDMIQFNIEYPSPIVVNPSSVSSYNDDVKIKAYITLQDFEEVGKTNYSRYSNTVNIGANRVLDFDNTDDILVTKFEVVDGTIIFPPKELVDFKDYYITVHLELTVNGVNYKPLQIKRMSFSSLSTNEKSFIEINAKNGNKVYTISRYDNAYSYKDKNPFAIYKDSTPYLYLTGDSGITLLPYNSNSVRAFSIPINQEKILEYSPAGIQIWAMYNKDILFNGVTSLCRINGVDRIYNVIVIAIDDGQRGLVKAFDAETGLEASEINFYQNGDLVKNPVLNPLIWTSLTISFGEDIVLNGVSGQLELYEGFIYNNIAIYQKSKDILSQRIEARTWQEVRSLETIGEAFTTTINYDWEDWTVDLWDKVYSAVVSLSYTIDGKSINGSFIGNSILVSDDSSVVSINSEGVDLISDVVWDTIVVKPV